MDEGERAAQRALTNRREALGDHWRSERRKAHVALLASFKEAHDWLDRATGWGLEVGGIFDLEDDEDGSSLDLGLERLDALRSNLATVQVIGTHATLASAEATYESLNKADGHLGISSGCADVVGAAIVTAPGLHDMVDVIRPHR